MALTRRNFLKTGITASACALACNDASSPQQTPNIILIMVDDIGYGEFGCYGQKIIATPRIDQLAGEGMRFTDFYAGAPVCGPSRCSIMTGLHTGHAPIRGNARDDVTGVMSLPAGVPTIAEQMKRRTSYTTGMTGRWHLGGEKSNQQPQQRGFDYVFGKLSSIFPATKNTPMVKSLFDEQGCHIPYEEYSRIGNEPIYETGTLYQLTDKDRSKESLYIDEMVTDKACEFIEAQRDNPFFLYMPYTIAHAPLDIPSLGRYADRDWPEVEKAFAASVTLLDSFVGRILDTLERLGLDDNTVVLFTSDNGPHREGGHDETFFNSSGVLQGMKRDLYEGGIRMPMIARWPGQIQPGSVTSHMGAFWDFMPTVLDLAGGEIPAETDGLSFAPLLRGEPQAAHEYLYWEFREGGPKQAIRRGQWKLIRFLDTGRDELYDVVDDPGETRDLSVQRPELVKELTALMAKARTPSDVFPLPID